MMELFTWIEQELNPKICNSDEFIYDDMESQSGFCLPLIYQPFNPVDPMHWQDRGSLFDFLFSTRGEGQKLLDFGPGDGWPSLLVAPFAGEVVGVDASYRRVEVCTANARRMGMTNARFVHNPPGNPWPFDNDSFDGVMAASSLEQSPDPRETLGEIYRVLRPGGRLRIFYEALGQYRNGQEREAWIWDLGPHRCRLYLYDRYIEAEFVLQYGITLALPSQSVERHFCPAEEEFRFERVTVERMEQIRPVILDARILKTYHPGGQTLEKWMKEIGFRRVIPSHSGAWFSGHYFRHLPEDRRPTDLQGVDELLIPIVKTVIEMIAPLELDPMITAVK